MFDLSIINYNEVNTLMPFKIKSNGKKNALILNRLHNYLKNFNSLLKIKMHTAT